MSTLFNVILLLLLKKINIPHPLIKCDILLKGIYLQVVQKMVPSSCGTLSVVRRSMFSPNLILVMRYLSIQAIHFFKKKKLFHNKQVTTVQFTRNQKYLLSAGKDGCLRIWDLAKGFYFSSSFAYC